jgi:hypothetical protein
MHFFHDGVGLVEPSVWPHTTTPRHRKALLWEEQANGIGRPRLAPPKSLFPFNAPELAFEWAKHLSAMLRASRPPTQIVIGRSAREGGEARHDLECLLERCTYRYRDSAAL